MIDQLLDITIDRIEAEASYWRNECDSSDEAQSRYARHELHCKECDLVTLRAAKRIVDGPE